MLYSSIIYHAVQWGHLYKVTVLCIFWENIIKAAFYLDKIILCN